MNNTVSTTVRIPYINSLFNYQLSDIPPTISINIMLFVQKYIRGQAIVDKSILIMIYISFKP